MKEAPAYLPLTARPLPLSGARLGGQAGFFLRACAATLNEKKPHLPPAPCAPPLRRLRAGLGSVVGWGGLPLGLCPSLVSVHFWRCLVFLLLVLVGLLSLVSVVSLVFLVLLVVALRGAFSSHVLWFVVRVPLGFASVRVVLAFESGVSFSRVSLWGPCFLPGVSVFGRLGSSRFSLGLGSSC